MLSPLTISVVGLSVEGLVQAETLNALDVTPHKNGHSHIGKGCLFCSPHLRKATTNEGWLLIDKT